MTAGDLVVPGLGAAALVAAILLAVTARRRVGEEPRCRRCGYDLSGAATAQGACPECGADLALRRAVAPGRPRLRRGRVLLAIALLLVAGAIATRQLAPGLRGRPWMTLAPGWWLEQVELALGSPAHQDRIAEELRRRWIDGALDDAVLDRLASRAIALQADPDRSWNDAWGDVVALAWGAGLLEDAQKGAFVRGAYVVTLQAEEPAEPGRARYAIVTTTARGRSTNRGTGFEGPWIDVELRLRDAAIAEEPLRIGGSTTSGGPLASTGDQSAMGSAIGRDLPPGLHDLRIGVDVTVSERRDSEAPARSIAAWSLDPHGRVRVAAPGELPSGEDELALLTEMLGASARLTVAPDDRGGFTATLAARLDLGLLRATLLDALIVGAAGVEPSRSRTHSIANPGGPIERHVWTWRLEAAPPVPTAIDVGAIEVTAGGATIPRLPRPVRLLLEPEPGDTDAAAPERDQ